VFVAATIAIFLSGAQDGRTKNHVIRWTEQEFQEAKVYAERYHIPWTLVIALRKAENGRDQSHGQISINWDIRETEPEEQWQVAQACRTISRAIIDFVARNPGFVKEYNWNGEKTWEGFLWEYRSKFVHYLAFIGWAPEDNPRRWEATVKQLWEQEHSKRGLKS